MTGGYRTMPFIFATEICGRVAQRGFHDSIEIYMMEQLHLPVLKLISIFSIYGGISTMTPLVGAFLADAFAGRFRTVIVTSILQLMGMISLTLSTILPKLRPPPCHGDQVCEVANSGQLGMLYISLLLLATSSGGIRPCLVAFGADQFDVPKSQNMTKLRKFMSWYYCSMGLSNLLAITLLHNIEENVGMGWALGSLTILMGIAIVTFVLGYPMYQNMHPAGSPFTRFAQVCVAAYRKRKLSSMTNSNMLYNNDEMDADISKAGKLINTRNMRFLDNAAIVTENDNSRFPNLWRLATIHRVEELKCLIRMWPILSAGILFSTLNYIHISFSYEQAATMDRRLTQSIEIRATSMPAFTLLAMLSTTLIYERVLVRVFRRFTKLEEGITFFTRMRIGIIVSILAIFVSMFVENKRKQAALDSGLIDHPNTIIPISVLWLAPQYCLMGVAESFMNIGLLEFTYDQTPESMRSTSMALLWTTGVVGEYIAIMLISLVSNWLPENLNKGNLENLYWVITLLQVLNFVYYKLCAKFYTLKALSEEEDIVYEFS